MEYKNLQIEIIEQAGLTASMRAMRLPKKSIGDNGGAGDMRLAGNLVRAGDDHAKAMRGIIVWIEIKCMVGFLIEFETYRHGVECLSTSSTMHNELIGLSGLPLAEKKQEGLQDLVYTRILHLSYQALRNIYLARRNHRHPDWQIFCRWIESLHFFDELIVAKKPPKHT